MVSSTKCKKCGNIGTYVTLTTEENCPQCQSGRKACYRCHGSGREQRSNFKQCDSCWGRRTDYQGNTCWACGGSGGRYENELITCMGPCSHSLLGLGYMRCDSCQGTGRRTVQQVKCRACGHYVSTGCLSVIFAGIGLIGAASWMANHFIS